MDGCLNFGIKVKGPPQNMFEDEDGSSLRKMERDRFMEAGGGRKEAREGELSLVVARYSFPRPPPLRLREIPFSGSDLRILLHEQRESNGAAVMPWNWDEFAYIEMAKSPGRWSLLGRVGGRMKRPFSPL